MSRPTAIGVHIFAGGFTEGAKRHLDVVAHWEVSEFGVETSRANHPELQEIAVSKTATWPSYTADVVYANPPCAPWSAAGVHVGSSKRDYTEGFDPRDARVSCFSQCFDQLERIRPTALVVESVQRAWTAGRKFIEGQFARARALGYATSVLLHCGLDCGLPMKRRRVFFVAHRVALRVERPDVPGPRTVREAWACLEGEELGPVAPVTEHEILLLNNTPPGGTIQDTYMKMFGETRYDPVKKRYKGRPPFLALRVELDKPSPVATGGCHFYNPTEPRHVSVKEMQVLAGYPKTYRFIGKLGEQYAQISAAVTPPCGAWVASVVAEAITRGEPAEIGGPTRVYDLEGKGRDEHVI